MNKAKSQKIHAQRRALERYSLVISKKDYEEIGKRIRKREFIDSEKISNTRTNIILRWKDKWIRVAYDKSRGQVCSFLPLHDSYG